MKKYKVTFVGKGKDKGWKKILYPHCQSMTICDKWSLKQVQVFNKECNYSIGEVIEKSETVSTNNTKPQ